MSQATVNSDRTAILELIRPSRYAKQSSIPTLEQSRPKIAGEYIRFSTLLQDSEQRQISNCDAYLAQLGIPIYDRYCDRGRTGLTTDGRPELARLMEDVSDGRVTIVVVEALDRIARNQADVHAIAGRLAAYGVELHQATTGKVDLKSIAFASLIVAQTHRDQLARQKAGTVAYHRQGLRCGRPAFGYALHPHHAGCHVLHPERALVVRNIFEQLASGKTPAQVAASMTTPTPSDCVRLDNGQVLAERSKWTSGMVAKLARLPLYAGLLLLGQTETIRDPEDYHHPHARPRSPADWESNRVDRLAIVDPDLWQRAQLPLGIGFFGQEQDDRRNRGRLLLTDLTVCGVCSGQADYLRTPGHPLRLVCRNIENCDGFGKPLVGDLEREVLRVLSHDLLEPTRIDVRRAELANGAWHDPTERCELEAELSALDQAAIEDVEKAEQGIIEDDKAATAKRYLRAQRICELRRSLAPSFVVTRSCVRLIEARRDQMRKAASTAGHAPLEYQGGRLASSVRPLVKRIALRRASDDRVAIEVIADDQHLFDGLASAAGLSLTLSSSIGLSAYEIESPVQDLCRDALEKAARGEAFGLPENVWCLVQPYAQEIDVRLAEFGWTLRGLLAAIRLRANLSIEVEAIPAVFGPPSGYLKASRRLLSAGDWGRLRLLIEAETPDFFWNVGPATFDLSTLRRPFHPDASERAQLLAMSKTTFDEAHAKRLVELSAGAPIARLDRVLTAYLHVIFAYGVGRLAAFDRPSPNGFRLDALVDSAIADLTCVRGTAVGFFDTALGIVIAHLKGTALTEMADFEESVSSKSLKVRRFREGGIEALRDERRLLRLSSRQIDVLIELANEGVDPQDPSMCVTRAKLVTYCLRHFEVYLEMEALSTAFRSKGFSFLSVPPLRRESAISRRTAEYQKLLVAESESR